ncbi:MAG TPA: Lrp/AsnC ligand binding domain-containing protein [Candidatus Nitrosotenuis sp.]|nr:Lrp/AsnC ligand binding domain-containing protein [Candidatus Nitrosotenuis sp.]
MAKAYVLLKCQSGSEDYVMSSLKSLDSVRHVVGVMGTYDILANLVTNSEEKLRDVVTKQIRKIPKVSGTYTLIADNTKSFDKAVEGKEFLDRYLSEAYALIDCEKNKESEVIDTLKKIPEVLNADVLLSSHQVMCNVVAPTFKDISDTVTKKIRTIPHISGTTTLSVISR